MADQRNQIPIPSMGAGDQHIIPGLSDTAHKVHQGRNTRNNLYLLSLQSLQEFLSAAVKSRVTGKKNGNLVIFRMFLYIPCDLLTVIFYKEILSRFFTGLYHSPGSDQKLGAADDLPGFQGKTFPAAHADPYQGNLSLRFQPVPAAQKPAALSYRNPFLFERPSDDYWYTAAFSGCVNLILKSSCVA